MDELRTVEGRVASITWMNVQTETLQQAPMMLDKVEPLLQLTPLIGQASLHAGQIARVSVYDLRTSMTLRFVTQVAGVQEAEVYLQPPTTITTDRRQFERIEFRMPILVRRPADSDWHRATGIDLSLSGLRFATAIAQAFSLDEELQVQLPLSNGSLTTTARIVRVDPSHIATALDSLTANQRQMVETYLLEQYQSQRL